MKEIFMNRGSAGKVLVFVLMILLSCEVGTETAKDKAQSKSEKHYQKEYNFSDDWFTGRLPTWKRILRRFKGKSNLQYLEIGVYEGRSIIWMLENILTHPTSKATGIDTFPGQLKQRFLDNLKLGGFVDRVNLIQGKSQIELRRLPLNTYDIIYIDGSHLAKDVLTDAALSWDLLKDDGILIFDDYKWMLDRPVQLRPKSAIDSFLVCFGGCCEVVHRGYQMIVKKQNLWELLI